MYPSEHTHQPSVLLRTSRELGIVGDVTATVDHTGNCCQSRPCRFWDELVRDGDLRPGPQQVLAPKELAAAWAAMPLGVDAGPPPAESG